MEQRIRTLPLSVLKLAAIAAAPFLVLALGRLIQLLTESFALWLGFDEFFAEFVGVGFGYMGGVSAVVLGVTSLLSWNGVIATNSDKVEGE